MVNVKQDIQNVGYLIAVRLRSSPNASKQLDQLSIRTDDSQVDNGKREDELNSFIQQNFGIFEKLRGKKRTLVNSVIQKLMKKINVAQPVIDEIAEMVFEDLEL